MSAISTESNREAASSSAPNKASAERVASLDVGWLLHSHKDPNRRGSINPTTNLDITKPAATSSKAEPTLLPTPPPLVEADRASHSHIREGVNEKVMVKNGSETTKPPPPTDALQVFTNTRPPDAAPPIPPGQKHHRRSHLLGRASQQDEDRAPPLPSSKAHLGPKPTRRASWITNLSSKFSSASAAATPTRRSSVDVFVGANNHSPGSPSIQFKNPFSPAQNGAGIRPEPTTEQKSEEKQALVPPHSPRRPSVLVQAGKERDDHPSFLQSALRKFSSSSSAALAKGAGNGPAAPRRILNVDPNRERVKIADLDPSKLKRVAFCVDVEVAGSASWREVEEYEAEHREQKSLEVPATRRPSLSMLDRQLHSSKSRKEKKDGKKEVKEVIGKDKAQGGALKSPQGVTVQTEEPEAAKQIEPGSEEVPSQPSVSPAVVESQNPPEIAAGAASGRSQPIPGTRKKEKKKRSEAERKERKEKKRKQAEANGQVPLELTGCHDEEDESSPSPSPPGASTPNPTQSPTTDPLRIYKRCAQLRETTVMQEVCDQISSPSATLAEPSGTVAILDLSETVMTLPELVTLGDWLAIVPIRKILLDDCQLSDEGVRVILSGLLACKTSEQTKHNKKLPRRESGQKGEQRRGVIEKVSLKGNSKLTRFGWKYIVLFLHMSKSLRAIDLSGIPFPDDGIAELSRTITANSTSSSITCMSLANHGDFGSLLSQALAERFGGNRLEELIMSDCSLSDPNIESIVDAALKCKMRRLGLAANNLTTRGIEHIVRYVESGVCEGLDLGDNDLHGRLKPLANSLTFGNNFFALSVAGCNLTPSDLRALLPSFVKLKNFRFVDLSNNKRLFSTLPNAVSTLRQYLPKMASLKRIHLNDVGLSPEHAIALADILPECPSLAHLSILENVPITKLMHAHDSAAQEEACALFASLMTAVCVSHTIVAIDIEFPSADSNEMVKALASQMIAYTLRNMEQDAMKELDGTLASKDAPETLLHIVGHMEGYRKQHDADEPAPDDDYLMGGNAIVKALGVCLGTAEKSQAASVSISPSSTPGGSRPVTPRLGGMGRKSMTYKKPRDMSKQLVESARKIRMRLQPALIREDRAGNDLNYRRLQFLDSTLQRMIQRFEDDYPDTKMAISSRSVARTLEDGSILSASTDTHALSGITSTDTHNALSRITSSGEDGEDGEDEDEEEEEDDDGDSAFALKLSRTSSNTSLASKALTLEEGRMLRFGQSQSVCRDIAGAGHGDDAGDDADADADADATPTTTTIPLPPSPPPPSPPPPPSTTLTPLTTLTDDDDVKEAEKNPPPPLPPPQQWRLPPLEERPGNNLRREEMVE